MSGLLYFAGCHINLLEFAYQQLAFVNGNFHILSAEIIPKQINHELELSSKQIYNTNFNYIIMHNLKKSQGSSLNI
jgi:hypothetical protein